MDEELIQEDVTCGGKLVVNQTWFTIEKAREALRL